MLRTAAVAVIFMMAACSAGAQERFGGAERTLAGYGGYAVDEPNGGYYGGAAISEDVPQIEEDTTPPQPSTTSTASTTSNVFSSSSSKGSVPSSTGAVVGLVVGLVGVTAVVAYVAVLAVKKVFAVGATGSTLTSALA